MRRVLVLVTALTMTISACGGSSDSTPTVATSAPQGAGDAANGEVLYGGTCIACHGPGGVGVEGLGKPWVGSDFINGRSDDEMVAFLLVGRPVDDPLNTTGIAMMPRGGNPSLTDADLLDLVAYMRTLNP